MTEELDEIEGNVKWSFKNGQMVKVAHPKANAKWTVINGQNVEVAHPEANQLIYELPSYVGPENSIVSPLSHPVVKPIVELDVYMKLRNLQSGQLHVVINSSLGFLNIGVKMKANVLKWNETISEIESKACEKRYSKMQKLQFIGALLSFVHKY